MNDFFQRMYNAMEQIVNEEEQNKQKQSATIHRTIPVVFG